MPFYDFNHTDYHELPLDYIMKLARESMGLELKVVGDKLNLVNDLGETLSSVTISYATKALTDVSGRELQTYLISAGVDNNALVFTNGKGEVVYVTPAFATKAEKDVNNRNLVDYVYSVTIAGDKVRVTSGDQVITDLTIPFATSSRYDFNSKDISTYAASLEVNGNLVELRDSMGRLLNSITVPYATAAATASDALHADDADHADEADHATDADAADYATLSTNATNAIQTAAIVGDNLVLTTYGGQVFTLTIPYSIRALKDGQSNEISKTYISNVTNDAQTGKLQFWDAEGNLLVELLPTVNKATHDSYDNLIADYIKQIIVSQNSDYMTVVHGTGTTDTIVIHYSETAWKDTNGNVIKNTYIKRLACIEDVVDGHYKLVAYNGDDPEAELFRIEIYAYAAQTDVNGKDITSYIADVDINNNSELVVTDGEGTVVHQKKIPMGEKAVAIYLATSNEIAPDNFNNTFVQVMMYYNSDKELFNSLTEVLNYIRTNEYAGYPVSIEAVYSWETPNIYQQDNKLMIPLSLYYNYRTKDGYFIGTTKLSNGDTVQIKLPFANGVFTNGTQGTILASGGGASTLNDLTDVHISNANPGDTLIYDGSNWNNDTIDVNDLGDTSISSPTNGQVLTYDGNTHRWKNANAGGGGGSASVLDLTDGSGNSIILTDAQQVGTVQLRLSGTPKTFTQVSTLLQSGSVVIKDSDGSLATIESTSAQSSALIVPYFNGNSRNVIKLIHQWNGNYGVSSVN